VNVTPQQLAELVAERIDYDRLADAIAARLERPEVHELVSAKEIAARIGYSPRWVREHKVELGAVPLSDGPRPRLGFYPPLVDRALTARRF
jgi:hypothetical protein